MGAKLVLDKSYLFELQNILASAKKSIDILAYSFAIGSAAGKIDDKGAPFKIAKQLADLKRKRKGLIIRLYIEGTRDTVDRNRVTVEYLEKHGVEICYGATHAKGFAIDGKSLLFGSTNLTNQSILKNRETNLLIHDKKLTQEFLRYFEDKWHGGEHGSIKLKSPWLADGDFKSELIYLIDSAKKRLDFSIYFFHLTEIEKAFIRAHERGVKLKGMFGAHKAFALSYVNRTKGTARRMFEAGITDLYYGLPYAFTHSKYLIKDRKHLLLGTGNWLHEDVKIHPQLYLSLPDPKLSVALAKHLTMQIKTEGTRVE